MPDTLADPRRLGNTQVIVSSITLGASLLGTQTGPNAAAETADAMLAAPYAAVDSSNSYTEGRSETYLGDAAARCGGLPAQHTIVTKTDADPHTGRFDRDRVWRSFEESQARLRLERLPLLHLHDPHTISFEEAFSTHGAVRGMTELREQGLVDAIGVAAGDVGLMSRYIAEATFDALLTHNRYTLIDRRAEPLIGQAAALGMGIFNAAPFGGGILAGKGTHYAYRASAPELLQWVERLRSLCQDWHLEMAAAALHFSLRHPQVHSTVVGVTSPHRILQLERLRATTIPDDFWSAVQGLGAPPSPLDD
ncbi:aldo/keto reductase [Streptomyces solaniscabiei]|uniref:aldo/keto reductase n=1 Tax=Streptomyces solaniscabiei TaxID=2683255 RepID=UPI001CE3788C|nr:aldo/keto reductase [Streptomyces solaniscabiei]